MKRTADKIRKLHEPAKLCDNISLGNVAMEEIAERKHSGEEMENARKPWGMKALWRQDAVGACRQVFLSMLACSSY